MSEFPTNAEWAASDWREVLAADDGETPHGGGPEFHDVATIPATPAAPFTMRDVKAVHAFNGWSPEDGGSVQLHTLVELHDGRWAVGEAWADYTGWGCRDGVDWRIAADRETAIRLGASEEGREALGL